MLYAIFCNIWKMIFCIRIIELRLHEYVIEKETEYVKHSFNVSHIFLVHYPHGEVLKMTLKKAIRISLKKWNEPKLCYRLPHAPKNLLNMKINHTYLLPCMIFSRDFWESNKPSLRLTKELSKIIFIIIIRYLFFLKTLQMKRSSKRHLAFFLIRYLNHRNNQLLYQ